MSSGSPYNLGFTAASLRPELARIVAEIYLTEQDWSAAKRRVLDTNALQARSATSGIRLEREFRQRLMTLTPEQISLLVESPTEDRTAIAWLAAIKQYPFLFEFAAETLRDKLAARDEVLRPSDYEQYVETKAAAHPEIANLSPMSRGKVKRVLMRMLREVGILTRGAALGAIQRAVLSPRVQASVMADSPKWLAAFLVPDSEIGAL